MCAYMGPYTQFSKKNMPMEVGLGRNRSDCSRAVAWQAVEREGGKAQESHLLTGRLHVTINSLLKAVETLQ